MERNFYNDDFEEFLKQKADQNKMYPSDRVWNNVYGSLHNRRRWFAIGLVLLLITSALMVSREVLLTGHDKIAANTASTPAAAKLPANGTNNNDNTNAYNNNIGIPAYKGPIQPANHTAHTAWNMANPAPAVSQNAHDNSAIGSAIRATDDAIAAELLSYNTFSTTAGATTASRREAGQQEIDNTPGIETPGRHSVIAFIAGETSLRNAQIDALPSFRPSILVTRKNRPFHNDFGTIQVKIPFRDRWSMKIYGSPIISYRRLSDLSRTTKYVPVAISYSGNIDSYVHHKPALGFELGTRIMYKLTPSLGVFSGLQFNYSRYYIDAYRYNTERATIALTSSSPAGDTLSNYTSIRNFGGYSPEQLTNQYLQVSVPLGAELKLLGNDRVQLGIAAAVQPTYLLASSTYLISSDFKNYVQNTDLIRRFNLHTNFEAFISYESPSGLKWQLGPQFRYQVFSSYSNKYPIREYITEFGIKLGITRILK
jgi:hypothetical protein